jgi:putative DNA primase/helicase
MGEMNNKEIGTTVYMLANGQAKQRMNEAFPKQWRLLFLSTGEIDLKSAMNEACSVTRAGQEVRLVDIEAVAGEYGVFDSLIKDFECSRSQSEHLQSMTGKYYGSVGVAFLERFTQDKEQSLIIFKEAQAEFIKNNTPDQANSQVKRVLNRFAIVAAGGELATSYGLTGWEPGEAYLGAKACFDSWLSNLSSAKDSQEESQAIEKIRLFIEQHGESRFADLNKTDDRRLKTIDRVGYKKGENDGDIEYTFYFLREVFKSEVCKGISWSLALKALKKGGYLKNQPDRLTHLTPETETGKRIASYAVRSSILEES